MGGFGAGRSGTTRLETIIGRQNIVSGRQNMISWRQNITSGRQNIASGLQNIVSCRPNIASCLQNIVSCRPNFASGRPNLVSGEQNIVSGRHEHIQVRPVVGSDRPDLLPARVGAGARRGEGPRGAGGWRFAFVGSTTSDERPPPDSRTRSKKARRHTGTKARTGEGKIESAPVGRAARDSLRDLRVVFAPPRLHGRL
jgi:Grass antifreeze beta roll